MGNPTACQTGWMCGILMDLSCHYQAGLVKRLFSRWHKQTVWKSFPSPASWDRGEIFQWFSDPSCEGVSDAVSTPPYRTAETAGGSSYSKEWKENNELLEQHCPLQ